MNEDKKPQIKSPRPQVSTSPIVNSSFLQVNSSENDDSHLSYRVPSIEESEGSSSQTTPAQTPSKSVDQIINEMLVALQGEETVKNIITTLQNINDGKLQPLIDLLQKVEGQLEQDIVDENIFVELSNHLDELKTEDASQLNDLIDAIQNAINTADEEIIIPEEETTSPKKPHWTDETHWTDNKRVKQVLLGYAFITAALAYTSYTCNKTGAEELSSSFEKMYGIMLNSMAVMVIGQIAGVGGVICNGVLNAVGNNNILNRYKFIADAFKQKSGYRFHITYLALAAVVAALVGSYQVVEGKITEATLEGQDITNELIIEAGVAAIANFLATLGQHVMFAMPGVLLYANGMLGDFTHAVSDFFHTLIVGAKNKTSTALSAIKALFYSQESKEDVPLINNTVPENTQKKYISSVSLQMIHRLIINAGKGIHDNKYSFEDQKRIITKILDEIKREAKFQSIAVAIEQCDDPLEYIQEVTKKLLLPKSFTYLDSQEKIEKADWIQFLVRFGVETAKAQDIKLESKAKGAALTALSASVALLVFVTCYTNFNDVSNIVTDALELSTSLLESLFEIIFNNPLQTPLKILSDIFYLFLTPGGALVKFLMYYLSTDFVVSLIASLPNTWRWLRQSTPAIQIGTPIITLACVILGVLSGLCYGDASLDAFPELLKGNLVKFFTAVSETFSDNMQSAYVFASILLGAGLVNAKAALVLAANTYRKIVHRYSNTQKAIDALPDMLNTIAQKMLEFIPDSKEALELREFCLQLVDELSRAPSATSELVLEGDHLVWLNQQPDIEEGGLEQTGSDSTSSDENLMSVNGPSSSNTVKTSQSRYSLWGSKSNAPAASQPVHIQAPKDSAEEEPKPSWSSWLASCCGSLWSTSTIDNTVNNPAGLTTYGAVLGGNIYHSGGV